MALTPLAPNSQQVQSGTASPVGSPPLDSTVPNIYYQLDAAANVVGVFMWDTDGQQWHMQSMSGSNWSEGLVAGWLGAHNAKHASPVPAEVSMASAITPRFSVAKVSAAPVPFLVHDQSSGSPVLVASGVFPAGSVHADAGTCLLVDTAANPVSSFLFAPTPAAPVAHFTATPAGGHAAMPADGETFMMHFSQVY
jgi:hypothetical protein